MQKMYPLSIFFALYSCFSYCQSKYDYKNAETESRKLIYSNPDSALVIIKHALAQTNKPHDTVYGNLYNLYGIYYGVTGQNDSSLYYFKKSLNYQDGYPNNLSKSLSNIAVVYRNKGNYKLSLKYLSQTLKIQQKQKDNKGIAKTYSEIASNYNYMMDFQKSVNYLLKAIQLLKKENSTSELIAAKQKLANTYLGMENFEFAIDLYKECLPEFLEAGMDKNYYLTFINLGECYIRLGQYSLAKSALQNAIAGITKFDDKELIGITYSKIGMIEQTQGNKEKAIVCYQKAIGVLMGCHSRLTVRIGGEYIDTLTKAGQYEKALNLIAQIEKENTYSLSNIQDRWVYEEAKAGLYEKTGDNSKAITAYKNTVAIMDTLRGNEARQAVQEIQAKFQTELQREKNMALAANNKALNQSIKNDRVFITFLILLFITKAIVIFLIIRSFRLKSRLQKVELKTLESEKHLIMQQEEHKQELINAQQETIEEKQRELTASALRKANYQDRIIKIIENCDADNYKNVNEIKKELLNLAKQKHYWEQFEKRFNGLHPEFSQTLHSKFTQLTKNDIEFCSLLKLKLSNKEIASLLQISHESVITKKYRIKKKMKIQDDEEFEKLIAEI